MQENVLRHLPSDENSVTTLLRALCVLKPMREVVVRFFTQGRFGADDVKFEGVSIQSGIGGAIPDMCLQADALRVVVEIKVSAWRGLTASQPQVYLHWLANQPVSHKFFVFLVPPHYAVQHRQEYATRKAAFCEAHPNHGIHFVESNWLELCCALDETGLSSTCVYARDFQNLLEGWYIPSPIKFTLAELGVVTMFNATAASAVGKLFEFIEQIASEFERAGFTVYREFQKRWWAGEYGIYLKCGNENVLFLGIWPAFWKDHGYPLCIGVHNGKWAPAILTRFQQTFANHVLYPPTDTYPFLTKGIEQSLLMEDAVKNVSNWLLQGYLEGIRELFTENELPTTPLSGAV